MDKSFRPILGKGEEYVSPIKRDLGGPKKDTRPSFNDAQRDMLQGINQIKKSLNQLPDEYRVNNVIVNMKMHVDYSAKSYHPNTLIKQSGAIEVGSKKWTKQVEKKNKKETKIGSEIFLRLTEEELNFLERNLKKDATEHLKGFIEDVRSVEDFYFDSHANLIHIFEDDWKQGRIELVIHPLDDDQDEALVKLLDLIEKFGGDRSKIKIRDYSPGPVFISAFVKRFTLEHILPFNPIRTAHPMNFRGIPEIRGGMSSFKLPQPPQSKEQSSITVGMFDGGIDSENIFLQDYVTERNPIETEPNSDGLQHGTAVAGAMLYGNLNIYDQNGSLPIPPVTVESYRVLPISDQNDIDLYEVIDVVEDVVPSRPDIKVYNLSVGPYGPIEDDHISRFTYVIDQLSENGDRWFSVAVGNDGNLKQDDDRRVQAPADAVNSIGVGSYTFNQAGQKIRAPYSSIGDGREGCKVKPDIVAFGGSDLHPFHLVGLDGKHKWLAQGTSFSAPLITSKAAEIMGRCNIADPLTARALLIHQAEHPDGKHDKYLGYGAVPDNLENILGCDSNKVTVIYRRSLLPKHHAKLEIPLVPGLDYEGMVDIDWTIAISTKTNPLNTENYTTACIVDTFHPNVNTFNFTTPGENPKKRNILDNREEVEHITSQGWIQSKLPASSSKNDRKYMTEQDRKNDFKWDTISKRSDRKKYQGLDQPFLVIHAMERNQVPSTDRLEYAIAVTVTYCNYTGDAYSQTLGVFNKLETAQIRSRNEIMVR